MFFENLERNTKRSSGHSSLSNSKTSQISFEKSLGNFAFNDSRSKEAANLGLERLKVVLSEYYKNENSNELNNELNDIDHAKTSNDLQEKMCTFLYFSGIDNVPKKYSLKNIITSSIKDREPLSGTLGLNQEAINETNNQMSKNVFKAGIRGAFYNLFHKSDIYDYKRMKIYSKDRSSKGTAKQGFNLIDGGNSKVTGMMLNSYRWLGLGDINSLLNFRLAIIGWLLKSSNGSLYEIIRNSHMVGVKGEEDMTDAETMNLSVSPLTKEEILNAYNPINNLSIDQENNNVVNNSNAYKRYHDLKNNEDNQIPRKVMIDNKEQIAKINVIERRVFNETNSYGIKNCADNELKNMINLLSSENKVEIKEGLILLKNMVINHMNHMEQTYGKYISQLTPVDFINHCKDNFFYDFCLVFSFMQEEKCFEQPLKDYGLYDEKLLTSMHYFENAFGKIRIYMDYAMSVVLCDNDKIRSVLQNNDENVIKIIQDGIKMMVDANKDYDENFMNEHANTIEYMSKLKGLSKEDEAKYQDYLKKKYPGKDNVFRFGIC